MNFALKNTDDRPVFSPNPKLESKINSKGAKHINFPTETTVIKNVEVYFPAFAKPRAYQDGDPFYSGTFVFSKEDPQITVLGEKINSLAERSFIKSTGEVVGFYDLVQSKLKLKAKDPQKSDDEQSRFLDQFYINLKCNKNYPPAFFDAQRKPITDKTVLENLWNGSLVSVKFTLSPYFVDQTAFGICGRLLAVQIIKAKTGSSRDISSDGFDSFEDEDDTGF